MLILYHPLLQSFFANVGVLFEEVTKENWNVRTPTQLFAHNIQRKDTQQIDPFQGVAGTGVLGRMADVLTENGFQTGSFSISGENFVLAAEPQKSPEINFISKKGVSKFNENPSTEDMNIAMSNINKPTMSTSGKFGKTWSDLFDQSVRQSDLIYEALNGLSLDTTFPSSNLGRSLEQVSKIIKAKDDFKQDRQFFFVSENGWDTHANQGEVFDVKLPDMNDCIEAFKTEMVAQGQWDNVVFVMASDFGRTLVSNSGLGTDHAWGGKIYILL